MEQLYYQPQPKIMKQKITKILLLISIVISVTFFIGCEKGDVKKKYVVTYKVKFSGNLTDDVKITYNDQVAYINPSSTGEWSTVLQFETGQSVDLRAVVNDDDCGRVSVTATILYNETELGSETQSGDCYKAAFVIGILP